MKELANFLQNHEYGFVNFVDWAFIHELLIKLPTVNAAITDSLYGERTVSIYGAILERFDFIPKGWIFAADTKPGCLSDLLSMDCARIPLIYNDYQDEVLETEELIRVYIIMSM